MRTLYHTPLDPASRQIRLALMEKRLPFDMHIENKYAPMTEKKTLNPSGRLPILVEDNDLVVCGAYPILEYLEESYPTPPLLGETTQSRIEVRRLIDWFNSLFAQEVTCKLLHEKIFHRFEHKGAPHTHILREGRQSIGYHLEYISTLTSQQKWLAGETLTMADLAAASHISALDYLGDIPWRDYPECKHWYSLMKSRPVFQIILQDRIAGIKPPPYYDNPDF